MKIQKKALADSWVTGKGDVVDHVRTVGFLALTQGCPNGVVFCTGDSKVVVTTESKFEIDYMINVLKNLRKQMYGRSK